MSENGADHWSFGKAKTTLVAGIHASILVPIMATLFIKTSAWWIMAWLVIDMFATWRGMTVLACLKRFRVQLGALFHRGYRVRKNKYYLHKIKRGMYE